MTKPLPVEALKEIARAPVESPEKLVLKRARALIANYKDWTIGHARDIGPDGHQRWCALGAISDAYFATGMAADTARICSHVARALYPRHNINDHSKTIGRFNDGYLPLRSRLRHRRILRAFDKALETL